MLVENKAQFRLKVHVKDNDKILEIKTGDYNSTKSEAVADIMKTGVWAYIGIFRKETYYPPNVIVKVEVIYEEKEADSDWKH